MGGAFYREALKVREVDVCLTLVSDEEEMSATFTLESIPTSLPQQTLIHTEWLHTDCLAAYYELEVFEERYWQLVEAYITFGVEHGQNMVLPPLFTPPLDMPVGGELPTVQLVGVTYQDGRYAFDFQLLDRWSAICRQAGIKYLKFSHLYTQWGAAAAPKIIRKRQGKSGLLFGWQTSSTGKRIRPFWPNWSQNC